MRRAGVSLLAAVLALMPTPATAQGGVRVTPVVIDMDLARGVASLRVRNGRAQPMAFEAQIYAWSQEGGADVLAPTPEAIVAPAVFETQAGGEQIVRLALMPAVRTRDREQTYRLILRELPPPEPREGFRVRLEMSLPVFAAPSGAGPRIEAAREANLLTVANRGEGHARIVRLEAPQAQSAPRYLLAGAAFTVPVAPELERARLTYVRGANPVPVEETFALAARAALADLR